MNVEILFVVYGNLDIVSGGYLYDRRLAEYLTQRGHTIRVCTPGELSEQSAPEAGLCIVDELCHPDFRHEQQWNRLPASGVKVAMVHHLAAEEDLPVPDRLRHLLYERQFFRFPDYVIVNSRNTADSVRRLTPYRGALGLAMPGRDSESGLSEGAREQTSHGSERFRLLFLGNVIPRKGLHHILRYMEKYSPANLELHVGGRLDADPEYSKKMQHRVLKGGLGELVHFHGYVEDEQKRQLLQSAHMLVVPSSHEGFGIVYLEAMGYGVVPVAGRKGGAGDIIRNGENGFLIHPSRPRELHRIIGTLKNNPAVLGEFQLNARETWRNHPGWNETFRTVAEDMEMLAASRAEPSEKSGNG
ncbi:glycosyltransferase family 4 protein [Salinispira pacifica]|uniref:Glycosyl transferase family 1 domain-containing protein n=1 Tax=Salinispira pacifica TaxID=1307761 RepID=V5WNT6_9SPIO|nr:glycosyltransferase family 4 protein [Salinispira pacifica]AHC16776.1 hypothetical protein L21SP2_3438 [Salinispira pacifica]